MGKYAVIAPEDRTVGGIRPLRSVDAGPFPAQAAASFDTLAIGAITPGWRRAWVTMAIHADAFRANFAAYLRSIPWRGRSLRVRSRTRIKPLAPGSPRPYDPWGARHELETIGAAKAKAAIDRQSAIRILPIVDCREGYDGFEETLRSLRCASATGPAVIVGHGAAGDALCISQLEELRELIGWSEAWLCFLRPGDRLAGGALTIYSGAAELAGEARLIYADDDLLSPTGKRRAPHFKPEWTPDLFEHHDFLTGSCIVRVSKEELAAIDGSDWETSLIGRAARHGSGPLHLSLVLHHRRQRPTPAVPGRRSQILVDAVPRVTTIMPVSHQVGLSCSRIADPRRPAVG